MPSIKRVLLALFIILLLVPLLFIDFHKEKIPGKKQIILISVDSLRGDHLSAYGYGRDTSPNLSKLIKDSIYYPHSYPNGCWTIPSHMSLLTGTLPSRHGINRDWKVFNDNHYPELNESLKTIAQVFKARQINTIKFALLPDEVGFSRGFEKNYRFDPFFNEQVLKNVLWELENNKEKDFFLFIHTWMVHAPYSNSHFVEQGKISLEMRDYIDGFRKLPDAKKDLVRDFQAYLEENHLFRPVDCVTLYDGGIHYVDRYIGKIIDKAKQLGIYKRLMFIVLSDHGEHFAEHDPGRFYSWHGKDFFEEYIKVPLIIKYPFRYRTGRVNHPVSLIDVFPTLFDFYKLELPAYVQGDSLLNKENSTAIISEAISEGGIEKKMIRVGDLKYIITMQDPVKPERVNWNSIIQRRLYNLKSDPLEQDDLYPDQKYRGICIRFEKMLIRSIKDSARAKYKREQTTISKETLKYLKSLGYL